MATENILMAAVQQGGDRQALHEVIRVHSIAAADQVKAGGDNDLIDRLSAEPAFAQVDVRRIVEQGDFVGRAPQQVDEFLENVVAPIEQRYADSDAAGAEIRV